MAEEGRPKSPPRFRRRLTGAFVLVAAIAAGVLGIVTYTISSGYRMRTFENRSRDEAELALALAPEQLTEVSFERLQAAYESRTGASTVARTEAGVYASAPDLSDSDIPSELLDPTSDSVTAARAQVRGTERYILASRRSGADYWFFFSTEPVQESLRDLRVVLGVAWLITTAGAAVVGRSIARRVLSPVRDAAAAARSLAGGLLETRLRPGNDDEFGDWTASFNEMAAALQDTIEQLEAAADRERRFTADVAHELRTPLAGMAATSSLLRDEVDRLSDRGAHATGLLLGDIDRLRELVLELLELARMDAGSEPVDLEPLDIGRSLDAILQALPADATVSVDVPAGLAVHADRARLRRILLNLIENGFRHGEPPVEVSASRAGAYVSVQVRDHGPGVDEELAGQIFDRFAKSDRSRAAGGSGLGLAIASGHAAAMHGRIDVHNAPDGGAVFSVLVPVAAQPG